MEKKISFMSPEFAEILNTIFNGFTALGTVGAIIVALWLSNRDNIPKLSVHATVGVLLPDMKEHLWLSCVNASKQTIVCTGFAFNPNKFSKKGSRIVPRSKIDTHDLLQTSLPQIMEFSSRVDQYFCQQFFNDSNIHTSLLPYKWLARIQLKFFWRVIAITNIKEFEGNLSKCLIEKILEYRFAF